MFLDKKKQWIKEFYFLIVFFLFFVSDMLTKYGVYYDKNFFINTSQFVKGIISIGFLLIMLLSKSKEVYKMLGGVSLLFVIFLIGQYFLEDNEVYFFERVKFNFKTFYWYISIFIFTGVLYSIDKSLIKKNIYNLLKGIDFFVLVQSMSIIIGLISSIYYFQSYGNTRFGINGLFINVTQGSYMYSILLLLYYYKYRKLHKKKDKILIIILLLSSSLIGTKIMLLFNFLFFNYILFNYMKEKKHIRKSLILIFIFSIILLIYGVKIITQSKAFQGLHENSSLFNVLSSNRYNLFLETFIPMIKNDWSFFNFLFGGGKFYLNRTEFEVIDFIWFFGLLGSIVYFSILNKFLFDLKKVLFTPPILFITIAMTFSGSFFSSINTIFLFVIFLLISNNLLYIKNENF
ncbi:hypothetical protein [Empedobacter brevis]|uniref:hypothetical protein n=1 Tax=Empedobacter brevis TaxID=247 RepID=UPI00333F80F8